MSERCTHLEQMQEVEPRTPDGCEEYLHRGARWVHLRMCQTWGHVGCCDSWKNKHATGHYHDRSHPLIQSCESGEDWLWCYVDQVAMRP